MAAHEGPAGGSGSKPFISADEIELYPIPISSGSYGTVHRGKCRGLSVAVKVLKQRRVPQELMMEFRKEVEIMSKISHPNVLPLLGICFEGPNYLIITEMMQSDLFSVLYSAPAIPLSTHTRVKIAYDIALGCNWIHMLGILHRYYRCRFYLSMETSYFK